MRLMTRRQSQGGSGIGKLQAVVKQRGFPFPKRGQHTQVSIRALLAGQAGAGGTPIGTCSCGAGDLRCAARTDHGAMKLRLVVLSLNPQKGDRLVKTSPCGPSYVRMDSLVLPKWEQVISPMALPDVCTNINYDPLLLSSCCCCINAGRKTRTNDYVESKQATVYL